MGTLLRRYMWVVLTCVIALLYGVLALSGQKTLGTWIGGVYVAIFIVVTLVGMIRDIVRGNWGLDILAVVAMVSTLAVGEVLASIVVVLMLSGGEALEDYAQHRAARDLENLLKHSPAIAHILEGGTPRDIDVEDVEIGDQLLVKPNEVVPVDCKLNSDTASFDESSLTGESLPVTKTAGDEILSGVVNSTTAVTVTATKKAHESQFQQIVALMSKAEENRAPIVRLADRYAIPFAVLSLVIGGVAWFVSGSATRFAEVMVLATPCPLLIAAPVAFIGGQAQASRNGVIVKSGAVLEQLSRIQSALFDKTGTLTRGTPEVTRVVPAHGWDEDELLRLTASAEQYSTHALARGIIEAARNRKLSLSDTDTADEVATNGVWAVIDGHDLRVGKKSFIEESVGSIEAPTLEPGEGAAFVAIDGAYAGTVMLADQIRPETPRVISWLRDNGVKNVSMLTGDNVHTAQHIAQLAGIDDVKADLLPPDKVRLAGETKPSPVLMVGDGINDAPVLARADVGLAIGAKSATAASEAADGVILRNSLRSVVEVVAISRHTVSVALTAIWLGIILSVGLMLVAAMGAIPAVFGALTQEIVDLVAILYALLALRSPRTLKKLREEEHTAP
ncbi:cadmium-exporting ATPase [Brevibacterium mcbrellneri ATCC 49030]|uniref:Cadmium-exporting ATPase n=1 Tax=Brevibacterium mcbrellneri ATCC 49030 TaxID=585530 RepID=D4YNZ7_9MICO|nr:heavy metal translocating P-type ATPase [Brevibacterium mcbrellneri]EFG47137.1 cadmium-exporting ATPase [Brevibacterium mcbrellneri ATCC 49030]